MGVWGLLFGYSNRTNFNLIFCTKCVIFRSDLLIKEAMAPSLKHFYSVWLLTKLKVIVNHFMYIILSFAFLRLKACMTILFLTFLSSSNYLGNGFIVLCCVKLCLNLADSIEIAVVPLHYQDLLPLDVLVLDFMYVK